MRVRSLRALSLLAGAAAVGLAGQAFGQSYQIAGFVSFGATGNAGTDDTLPNGGGNGVNYTSMLIQSYAGVGIATQPGSYLLGAGGPAVIGTMSYKVQTSYGFSSGVTTQIYATSTTAFYYTPATGFNFFGQYSPNSTNQYQTSGLQTNYSNGTASSPPVTTPFPSFVSASVHSILLQGENSVGQVIGTEAIEATDSKSAGVLGKHAFMFNTSSNTYASLGLTSLTPGSSGASYATNFNYANFNYTTQTAGTSSGTFASSTVDAIDNLGNASGTSLRFFNYGGTVQSSSASNLGTSTWFYNANTHTSVETGLYGAGYSFQKTIADLPGLPGSGGTSTSATNTDRGINGGFEIGTTAAVIDNGGGSTSSLGTEGWEYSPATGTTPVSLFQSGLTPNVDGFGTNFNGSALSYSFSVTGSGGTGSSRSTTLRGVNANGQVVGTNTYYAAGSTSSKGTDAWIYTPGTHSYKQVGLLTNGFATGGTTSFVNLAAARVSDIAGVNDSGATIGTSTEYLSSQPGGLGSTATTTVAWFNPAGGTAYQIGLNDPFHVATGPAGIFVQDFVNEITNSGLVGGTATRYTPGTSTTDGSDAWVFDSKTGKYYILDPFFGSSTTSFQSQITYLSDTGVVTGEYKVGNGNFQSFLWSEAGGWFDDLTSITPQTDPNTTQFANAYSYDPATGTIFTTGNFVQNGVILTPGGGADVLTPVPEPASMALLGGITAASLLRRRRRAAR